MNPHGSANRVCRNCGAPAPAHYCGECGQETALHPPTLREFLHEFIGHYVALEGALWRTLRMLLLRPGRLTREYLDGRRRHYVLPLRLYLTASFVFFLVLKLLPSAIDEVAVVDAGGARTKVTDIRAAAGPRANADGAAAPAPAVPMRAVDCGGPGEPACNLLERFVNRVAERSSGDPRSFYEHLQARLFAVAPYAMFLLLPVFAGIMQLAYRNRRMTYGEHVVFSLHLQTFWFLALLVVAPLPESASDIILLVLPVYGVLAMHEVYRGRWSVTILRAAFVSVVYAIVLLVATVLIGIGLLALA